MTDIGDGIFMASLFLAIGIAMNGYYRRSRRRGSRLPSRDVRMECLKLARGDLKLAESYEGYVLNVEIEE